MSGNEFYFPLRGTSSQKPAVQPLNKVLQGFRILIDLVDPRGDHARSPAVNTDRREDNFTEAKRCFRKLTSYPRGSMGILLSNHAKSLSSPHYFPSPSKKNSIVTLIPDTPPTRGLPGSLFLRSFGVSGMARSNGGVVPETVSLLIPGGLFEHLNATRLRTVRPMAFEISSHFIP